MGLSRGTNEQSVNLEIKMKFILRLNVSPSFGFLAAKVLHDGDTSFLVSVDVSIIWSQNTFFVCRYFVRLEYDRVNFWTKELGQCEC